MDKTKENNGIGIHTFNVRGMRNKQKRSRLFTHFKNKFKVIIYLQETYSAPGDLEKRSKEWGSKRIISNGSCHSRGVAILLPKHMEYQINECICDDNGRYILIDDIFEGIKMTLLNVYAPTSEKTHEQSELLDKIIPLMQKHSCNLILRGDLNTTFSELNKFSKGIKISTFANRLQNIMDDLDLCDIYRILNPDTRRYTWRKMTHKGIRQTRYAKEIYRHISENGGSFYMG